MTNKRITYSDHAARMLKRRGVTRQQVRWLLAKGIREVEGEQQEGQDTTWGSRGYLGSHEAQLVYIEGPTGIYVITVQFLDRWKE